MDLETIESDIDDFKTRGILKDRADKFKPTLDRYNEQRFEQVKYERHQEELQKQAFYNNHIDAVIKNVIEKEAPGGFRLKTDQKQYLAEMFVPNQEIGGLPIYSAIDHLLANSDYDTLTKVALLITDPGTFEKMYSGKVANNVAESLQRKLRDSKSSNTEENMMQQTNQPQRQKLTFN
jgi:hypothetical protein